MANWEKEKYTRRRQETNKMLKNRSFETEGG
jgi:hypothetical protein